MTGRATRPNPIAVTQPRDRALVASCVVVICALAWAYLTHLGTEMSSMRPTAAPMAGMEMPMNQPWQATEVLLTFTMWAVMMVGMMGPAAMRVLLLFAAAHARRAQGSAVVAILPFGLGYLAVWLGFSAGATAVQWVLHHAELLSPAMAVASPRLAGALLVAAGAYQLTPAKDACLQHCQSPMSFLMSHWRNGRRWAFRMGLRHGFYCLGCCWALMGVLFAVGVMNLVVVGVLTAFILLERVGHVGARVARAGGLAMIGVGGFLIVA